MYVAQQLGRYHLLDRIACGGMAEIFRAKTFDAKGNVHMVAIKRVLRALAEDDAFLQMLVDEAKIVSILDHPNIARVYEFARYDDDYFLAMEYVDGKDLRSLIDRCRAREEPISPACAALIMIGVLDGLHAAHDKTDATGNPLDIVHRDVSPSNVIVAYDGQVKLCDFGIAKARLSRVQTRAGVVKGKVRYMSPEQTRGWQLDRRSDVFSAGSVLYELVTQHPAFHAAGEMELVLRVREARHPRPTRYTPDLPKELQRIIRKAMTRSLTSRYASAADFAQDLRVFLQDTSPQTNATDLGRLLRRLYRDDIDRDLRKLEDYILEAADPADMGDNLIADKTDTMSPSSGFTPVFEDIPVSDEESTAVRTTVLPRVPIPESRLPSDVSLHDADTHLHDADDPERWVIKGHAQREPSSPDASPSRPRPRPPEQDVPPKRQKKKTRKRPADSPSAARAPRPFHQATTEILPPRDDEE